MDFHETFAVVASAGIVRMIIAIAVADGLYIHHLDVVRAYLYSPLAKRLYMYAPPGVRQHKGEV